MSLRLRTGRLDGIFASASLFHVPPDALPEALWHLHTALRGEGILYALNPRGRGQSGWAGDRYCTFYSLASWRGPLRAAGFRERGCEPRPMDADGADRRWVASVWQKR